MKTKIEQNNAIHPQLVEIPQPLEVHPSVSQKAAAYLTTVCDAIAANPKHYDQGSPSICGGPMCVVGHLAVLAGLPLQSCGGVAVRTGIGDAAGMTIDQIERFYWTEKWPSQFREENTTSQTGIARIEHFLRTGL